jgi:hypothetical protein
MYRVIFAGFTGLIAGKPAPTVVGGVHRFCVHHITCGSGLARDEASKTAES